ncbi:MAG: oligosaccharide flippase family protein [Verrucomicrobiota bacterium]
MTKLAGSEPPIVSKGDWGLLRQVGAVFYGKLASTALNAGIKVFIASFFLVQGNGVFAIHLSIVGVVGLLATMGFGNAILKLSASHYKDEIDILKQDYVTMITAALLILFTIPVPLIWVLAESLAEHFGGDATSALLFQISALTLIPHCMLEINVEVIRGIGKSYAYVVFKEVGIAGVMLISMFMMMQSSVEDILIPVKSHAIGVIVFSLLCFLMVIRSLYLGKSKKVRGGSGHSLWYLMQISLPMMLSKGLVFILPGIPILVLGFFTDSKEVGIYWMAYALSLFARVISYSMNVVVAPAIASHYKLGEHDQLLNIVKRSVRLTFWISLPILLGMMALSSKIMGIAGAEFISGWPVMCVFLVAHLVDMICGPVGYLLTMTGKERVFAVTTSICTFTTVVTLFVLCPLFQGLGAALAYLVFFVIWNLSSIRFIERHLGFSPIYIPGITKVSLKKKEA